MTRQAVARQMAETDPSLQRLKRRLELVRAHVDCENRHNFDGILPMHMSEANAK